MSKENLEKAIKTEVKPIIEHGIHKFLGVSIDELTDDISSKLESSPLWGIKIDFKVPFKKAKKRFKEEYLKKILKTHYGNVSLASKIADVNRRSIHRLVADEDAKKIRKEMLKSDYVKQMEVTDIIEDVLQDYKEVIHPIKLQEVYDNVPEISKDVVKHLPKTPLTLKEAEAEFEKQYLRKALARNSHNISKSAKEIGLEYASLHRKLKKLKLI
ncbi:helix-turn-helix domain-containing protein [Nanoarchaeota archaeon]